MNTNKKTARYLLVQKLSISNKEAAQLIAEGKLLVNEKPAGINQSINAADHVLFEGRIIQEPKNLVYLAFYKPRGIETTLNKEIDNNLTQVIDVNEDVFPLGRLDKESEGLLLLTNDGALYQGIVHSKGHQEKEYIVTVDKPLTPESIYHLSEGVIILGKKTRAATVVQLDDFSFKIILTQGLNRQIRRMCYKLGYEVIKLIRVRIASVELNDLKPGDYRILKHKEVAKLKLIAKNLS